jgi:hypothetical protein
VADTVVAICEAAEDVRYESEEDRDAVGEEEVCGVVGVEIY